MRQGGGTVGRRHRETGIAFDRIGSAGRQTLLHQGQGPDDAGEEIVEVMRDAAGQLSDGLHLLGLPQLVLGAALRRDLVRDADEPLNVPALDRQRRQDGFGGARLASHLDVHLVADGSADRGTFEAARQQRVIGPRRL